MKKQVTERDIRLPQFKDAELDDLEFDSSGDVVRKDRFETSMRKIQGILRGEWLVGSKCGWTCEQVVDAVKQITQIKDLAIALSLFPDDAEFYHPENKTYVRNIAKDALAIARSNHESSTLIDHETRGMSDGDEWQDDSAWLDYTDVLLSKEDVINKINSIK